MKTKEQIIKKIIKDHFGHFDLDKIRKYLKSKSVNEYGCYFYNENIGQGVELSYTSNPNCFASYLVHTRLVGMVSSDGLSRKDITKAGRQRGCGDFYIFK